MHEAGVLADFLASPLGRFRVWKTPEGESPQGDFLRACVAGQGAKVAFRSGNRVGKTTIGAVNAGLILTGWHPWFEPGKATHGWISTLSWDFCAEVVWPALKEVLPPDQIASITYRRRSAPEIPNQIVMRNGNRVTFKSAEQKRAKYQGAKLDWLWVDEEHPADIIEEARARLIDTAGLFFCTLTPVMRARWVLELEREPGTVVVRASMLQAARAGILPMQEVEAFAARLPERQRRVRIHGDLVALEGAVYPGFTRASHCAIVLEDRLVLGDRSWPWPLPEAWQRYAAIDFGFANPTAIPIVVKDPFHNRIIVERLLYSNGIRASEWARHLHRFNVMGLASAPWADHDSFARAELAAEGVHTLAAEKDVSTGIEAVARLLEDLGDGAPGLVLALSEETDPELGRIDAEKLAWEIEHYHYKPQDDAKPDVKDEPVKKDDHACDATRYLAKGVEATWGGAALPPELENAPSRQMDNRFALQWPDEDEDEDW